VALAMSRRPQDVLPAAQHWVEAARSGREGDVQATVEACRRAGRHAAGRADHALAAKFLDSGLEWVDRLPLPDGLRLGLEAADAAKRAGLGSIRARYLEIGRAAAEAGDVEALCQAALGPSRGFFSQIGEADEEQIELLRTALAASGTTEDRVRAQLMATLASELTWLRGDRERFELADAALAVARSAGDKATLARVLSQRLLTIDAADTADERRTSADELLMVAEEIADPAVRFDAAFQAIRAVVPFGDLSAAAALLASAQQVNEQLRQPIFQWLIDVSLAALAFARGDLQEAESMAEAARDVGRLAGQEIDASILYNAQLVDIRRAQGRLGELAELLRAVGASPHASLIGPRLLCELGETDLAEQVLENFNPEAVRRDMVQLPTLANYASIVFELGAAEKAGRIYEILLPFADLFPHGIDVSPVVHHYLGLLASTTGRDPEPHLEHAIDQHRRAGCPLLLAESLMAWAAVGHSNRQSAAD
jgi:tetratricopeptide (TPR) repeat protein